MKKLLLILSAMFVCVTSYAERRVRVSQSVNNYVAIDKESVSGREKVCVRADHKELNHDIVVDVAVYEIKRLGGDPRGYQTFGNTQILYCGRDYDRQRQELQGVDRKCGVEVGRTRVRSVYGPYRCGLYVMRDDRH